MKRLCSLLIISSLIAGTVFAQSRFEQQDGANKQRESRQAPNRENRQRDTDSVKNRDNSQRQRERASVTVEGTLKLEKGFIALASGDTVYYVPMLQRYVGFIDGLKEGAKVSVEGYQFKNMLHPQKVTINGKDYDFQRSSEMAFGPHRGGDNRNNKGDMHGKHGRNKQKGGHGRGNVYSRKGRGFGRGKYYR